MRAALLLLTGSLLSCAVSEDTHLAVEQAAPPPSLYFPYALHHTLNYLEVTGAGRNATVHVVVSPNGLGSTGPVAALGGLTLDLAAPVSRSVPGNPFRADAAGTVVTGLTPPLSIPVGTVVGVQAVARAGGTWTASNAVEVVIGRCGTLRVGLLPGYPGSPHPAQASALFWQALDAAELHLGCHDVELVEIASGFDVGTLAALDLDTLWSGNAATAQIAYDADEIDAIETYTANGGGLVLTGQLSWNTTDNTELAALVGVDGDMLTNVPLQTSPEVTILEPGHPLARALPTSPTLLDASFPLTQDLSVLLGDAALPGTDVVALAADGVHGVVAVDDGYRAVWFTGPVDVFNSGNDEALQAAYNAIVWTSWRTWLTP
jgi:hypothetical protein